MLDKQPFTLPLAQGMNQKKDPKTLTGGLSLVENGIYRKDGELTKRPGWTSLVKTLSTGGSLSSADACATFDNEILLWSDNHVYTWSAAQQKWFDRGAAYSAAVNTKQIIASNASYRFPDSVYLSGNVLVAYEKVNNLRYQMYDYETGAILQGDTDLGYGISIRCVTISSLLFIFCHDGTQSILGKIISPATGLVTSAVTIATDFNSVTLFDAIAVASDTIMLVYANLSGNIVIKYLNSSLGVRGGTYTDSSGTAGSPTILTLIPLSSSRVMIAYIGSAANVQSLVVSATGSVGSVIDLGYSKTNASRLAGHLSGINVVVYIQYQAASRANDFVQRVAVTIVGPVITSAAVFLKSVGIATRGFVHDGVGFIGLVHSSDLQSTYFIADENKNIVSRHQPGTASGITSQAAASVWSAVTGRYEFAIANKTRIIATTDTQALYTFSGSAVPTATNLYSPINIAVTAVDFQDNSNFTAVEMGGSLLIAGGAVNMYDGLSVVEQGFFLYPEGLASSLSVGVGSIVNGTYLYVAIYEWTDAKGLNHRSAPSIPLSVTVTGGPKNVSIVVPTLRLTQKRDPLRSNVTIAIYRTLISQSTPFYRVSSITSPTENSVTADNVTIVDSLADSSLPGRDILYTAGGVLDNAAPVAAKYMKAWRGRVMLGGGEDSVIQYSKPIQKGYPVEFAAENMLELESDGGQMTAFEILDEKLVVYKLNWAYLTYGDGPDALGLGGAFAPLERISTCALGCIDQQSTCGIPGAVIFKSTNGYQMLGRDLSLAFIGADVEDYNSLSVTSATLFALKSEVRITNSDGVALVFNYEFQRWSVFTNHESVDGMQWDGQFVHVKSDGSVCIETDGTYRDNSVNYSLSLTTGWQTLTDISGFQRIYRAQIVGEYVSPCTVTLQAGFDFSSTWLQSASLSFIAIAYRYQFPMQRQKCESVRFRITVSVSEFVYSGEGMKLTSMTLLFGIKRGLSKLASALKSGLT